MVAKHRILMACDVSDTLMKYFQTWKSMNLSSTRLNKNAL